MNQNNEQQLQTLVNNTYNYKGKRLTVKSFKEVSGTYVILTNSQTLTCYPSELDTLINQLIFIEESQETQVTASGNQLPEVPVKFTYQKSETHVKLENALSKMIDKVQTDKKAIPKAKALCEIANTMVNLEKQQLAFLKASKQI
jgi:hypothetical protein